MSVTKGTPLKPQVNEDNIWRNRITNTKGSKKKMNLKVDPEKFKCMFEAD